MQVGQDCRLAKTRRGEKEHPKTCPKDSDSLLWTITDAIKKYQEDDKIEKDILEKGGYIIEDGKEMRADKKINTNDKSNNKRVDSKATEEKKDEL